MLPSVTDLTTHHENCYSFVVAIAKRARQVAENANEEGIMLEEKPVKIAVREYIEGKFRIETPPDTEEDQKPDITDDDQVL